MLMPNQDWSRDGYVFRPDDQDGEALGRELDAIMASAKPKQFMQDHYPDVPKDVVPDKWRLAKRASLAVGIGLAATAAAYGFIQFYDSIATIPGNFHP